MKLLKRSQDTIGTAGSGNFRSWLSVHTPGFFGVEYSQCTPVLARGSALKEDLAGRLIEWSKPPKDVVFYNLVPDPKIIGDREVFELDYILGESDAASDIDSRLSNGTLVYWGPTKSDTVYKFDDALILRYIDIQKHSDLVDEEVNPDWLCLRRVGHTNGNTHAENGKLVLRSLDVQSGELVYDEIAPDLVKGRVFGKYSISANSNRVRMAASLPFAVQ